MQHSYFIKIYSSFFHSECWESDPHSRPSFEQILEDLDHIVHSSFTQTPHESFHTMQDDWRQEIEEVLLELRRKEKVGIYENVDLKHQYHISGKIWIE